MRSRIRTLRTRPKDKALDIRYLAASLRRRPRAGLTQPFWVATELSRDLSGPTNAERRGLSDPHLAVQIFATHWPPERHTGSRGLWGWGDSERSRFGAYCRRLGACLPAGLIISIALGHPALRDPCS